MKLKINKYIVLLLVCTICVLVLLPGCFTKEKNICSLVTEDLAKKVTVVEQGEEFYSETFTLSPGVYQVRVKAEAIEESVITLEMKQYGGEYRSLRANSVSLSAGQTKEAFEVYVASTIDEGYLQCNFSGCNYEAIQELDIVKLNWGNRIALFWVVVFSAILFGAFSFRDKIISGKIDSKKQIAFWALLGGVFTAFYPYLTTYMNLGDETIFQLLRIEGLTKTLLAGGQFPVRVQSNWMYDHGYLVSGFCSDLFLMIPAFFRMVGFSLMTAYKMFVFIITVATAWIAYISFEKCTKNVYAAMVGSLVYLLMPYRMYLFYNKGAVDELAAMVFLPLVLAGMYLLFDSDKKAWIYLTVGLSGVLHSDVILCGIMILLVVTGCVIGAKKLTKSMLLSMAGVGGLLLLVNAGLWLPMLVLFVKDKYHLHTLLESGMASEGATVLGMTQFFLHAGEVREGMAGYQVNPIGAGLLVLLIMFGCLFLQKAKSKSKYRLVCNILLVAILVSVVLALFDLPEVIMTVTACMGGMFAAFFVCWQQEECKDMTYKGSLLVVLLVTIAAAMYQVNDIAYEDKAVEVYTAENLVSTTVMEREYLLQEAYDAEIFYHEPVLSKGLSYQNYKKNGTTITMDVSNVTNEEAYLEVPLTGYLGYSVEGLENDAAAAQRNIAEDTTGNASENATENTTENAPAGGINMLGNAATKPYITESRGQHGDLRIAIPVGYSGRIEIEYTGLFIFRVAELISVFSILGCVCYGISKGRRKMKHGCKKQKAL